MITQRGRATHGRVAGLAAALVAGLAAGPVSLHAEPSPEPDTLAEVVVLAQKRATALQQAPLAVTALGGADLAARGLRDIRDLAAAVPTLGHQESAGAPTTTLRIRRVGNIGNIPTFEPAVGYFVDGAYRTRSFFAAGPLLDVERVEVLRGPQTSLYGRNVGAGVVAVYTNEPGEHLEAAAEATLGMLDVPGDAGLASLRARASGTLAGKLRAGFAAGGDWQETAARDALPPRRDGNALAQLGARGQLAWSDGDRLSLRLVASWLGRDNAEGESDVVYVPGGPSAALLEALQAEGLAGTCPDNRPRNRVSCSVATNRLDLEATDVALIADFRLANDWLLHSLTGYEHYRIRRDEDDAVQLLTPLLFFRDSEDADSVQQELRLSAPDGARLPWLAGLFYFDGEHERGARGRRAMFGANGPAAFDPLWEAFLGIPLALPGQDGFMDSRLRTEHVAAFGQVVLPLGSRVDFTAAARWAHEEKRASIANAVTSPGASVVANALTPAADAGGEPVNGRTRRSGDGWTWSLTPKYTLDDRRMMYATWARGGKFGGFDTGFGSAPLASREYGDEKIDHVEAGGRLRFAAGRGRLGASAFMTRYRDYQDASFQSAQFQVSNVSRVDLEGVELEGEYLFPAGTHVDFALSLADLRYRRNTTGMCAPGRVPDGSLPGTCDLSGERPIAAPPWAVQAGLEYPFRPLGIEATLRADWRWTDRYNTSFSADPRLVQDDYHDVALRLGMRIGPNLELVVAGENLLDETIAHYDSVLNFFNDPSYQSYLGMPRRWSVTLRASL